MTKRKKNLFAAVVILTGGLLVLAAVFWWRSANAPVFRFLGDQRPVWHSGGQKTTMDIYSWPAEYESIVAQAGQELLRAGFVDLAAGATSATDHTFVRPGFHEIVIIVRRAKFEGGTEDTVTFSGAPGWVVVHVRHTRHSLWAYLRDLLRRRPPAPPPQPAPAR